MSKYRVKPHIVDVCQWTGDNLMELSEFLPPKSLVCVSPDLLVLKYADRLINLSVGDVITKHAVSGYQVFTEAVFHNMHMLDTPCSPPSA